MFCRVNRFGKYVHVTGSHVCRSFYTAPITDTTQRSVNKVVSYTVFHTISRFNCLLDDSHSAFPFTLCTHSLVTIVQCISQCLKNCASKYVLMYAYVDNVQRRQKSYANERDVIFSRRIVLVSRGIALLK